MKEFAIGVATVVVGVALGMTIANVIDRKLINK